MPSLKKMSSVTGPAMPHNGQLLQQAMAARHLTKTQLAQLLNVTASGVQEYLKQPTLYAALLWKAGLVLEENFFARLAAAFPVQAVTDAELNLQQQIAGLQAEITALKIENETYKKILAYIRPGA